jgi:hypothetical protein
MIQLIVILEITFYIFMLSVILKEIYIYIYIYTHTHIHTYIIYNLCTYLYTVLRKQDV